MKIKCLDMYSVVGDKFIIETSLGPVSLIIVSDEFNIPYFEEVGNKLSKLYRYFGITGEIGSSWIKIHLNEDEKSKAEYQLRV